MTAKEAIEILKEEHDYAQLLSYVNQALEMAIKALEKQIPKKAISTYKGHYKCPTCENYIDITDDDLYVYEIEPPKCCDECGQALDWSGDND